MKRTPTVSVVMPVFNAANTVGGAIASICAQSMHDWELIAIDDGSTDGTRAIVEQFARDDERIRLIARPHEGVAAAANAGVAAARGEFIARMDADDESHAERLGEQLALLRAQPDLGLASCLVEFGGDRAVNAGYALHVDWINSLVTPEEIALNRFVELPFANPSAMFRRELVPRHGGCRSGDFPEDYEQWLRWLGAGVRMAKVPRVLLRWNDPPQRLSRTDSRYSPEAFFRVKAEWVAKEVGRVFDAHTHTVPERRAQRSRPTFVWGAGRPTRKRAAHLESHGLRIAGYIDVDSKKTGRMVGGVPVIAMQEIPAPGEVFVLGYVSSRGAREFIRSELRARGHVEGRDFLMCA